ncbi:kinase-like domain-containing protein [Lasiosphaeria ovina]|uniref:Kinase-like domain-containing protein n=1 Tax=Lasiosphaeria ovina TaxID=92902 RepID=A0AAE0JTZ0_9PEZI|nr:kinase-like domain-containing protein [Lasiosphaeria ovina]
MAPPRSENPNEQFRDVVTRCSWENEDGQEFLPHTELEKLATEKKVSEILRHSLSRLKSDFPESDTSSELFLEELTSFIIPNSVRIFLTLVMIEQPWLIQSFRINGRQQDTALPVPKSKAIVVGDRTVSTIPPWTPGGISAFYDQQWTFLSPILTTGTFSYGPFSNRDVLPYVQYKPKDGSYHNSKGYVEEERNGSYGVVEHRVIHADHIQLLDDQVTIRDKNNHHRVAVKRFSSNHKTKITNEARNLDLIRQKVKSDYIIKAIAFYEQGGQCYLVFPWAERGTLQEHWMHGGYESERTTLDKDFVAWFFQQLSGVTEAVAMMHEQLIRHGDLKPQNILCFPDTSQSSIPIRLVITDVGTAKQHVISTEERRRQEKSATTTTVSTVRYEAPELKNHDIDTLSAMSKTGKSTKQLSRTFDVWSLGCIWTEFVIWLLYGYNAGYDQFNTATEGNQFWQDSQGSHAIRDVRVTEHVNRWLDHVENLDGRCCTKTALGGLVSLIRTKLLVVEVEALHKPPEQSAATATSSTVSTTPSPSTSSPFWKRRPFQAKSGRGQPESRPATADTTNSTTTVYRATANDATRELKKITEQLKRNYINAAGQGNPKFTTGPKLLPDVPASTPYSSYIFDGRPAPEPEKKGKHLRDRLGRKRAR